MIIRNYTGGMKDVILFNRVNSGAPEGYTVHPPLVRQVVLHINDTSILVVTSVRNKMKNKDKKYYTVGRP